MKDGIMNPWAVPEFQTFVLTQPNSVFLMFAQRDYTEQE